MILLRSGAKMWLATSHTDRRRSDAAISCAGMPSGSRPPTGTRNHAPHRSSYGQALSM